LVIAQSYGIECRNTNDIKEIQLLDSQPKSPSKYPKITFGFHAEDKHTNKFASITNFERFDYYYKIPIYCNNEGLQTTTNIDIVMEITTSSSIEIHNIRDAIVNSYDDIEEKLDHIEEMFDNMENNGKIKVPLIGVEELDEKCQYTIYFDIKKLRYDEHKLILLFIRRIEGYKDYQIKIFCKAKYDEPQPNVTEVLILNLK
jgi:hypothetical protein